MSNANAPWIYDTDSNKTFMVFPDDESMTVICRGIKDENHARQIAALPEAFEALRRLHDARGHTTHRPAGGKAYDAVVIPRELYDSLVTEALLAKLA